MPLHQVLDGQGVRFDTNKFNWLGSTGPENSGIFVWHTTGIKTIGEVMEKEVILGGTGAGSGIVIFPTVMNNVLGTRFKIVIGYKSSEEINIAMERGEIEARSQGLGGLFAQQSHWIEGKQITFLAQVGAKRDMRLAHVPLLTELAKTEEQRQVLQLISLPTALGKPYVAPPDVEADRIAILRKGFNATLGDETFLTEMDKLNIEIDAMNADEVTQIVHDGVNTPPALVADAKAAMELSDRDRRQRNPE